MYSALLKNPTRQRRSTSDAADEQIAGLCSTARLTGREPTAMQNVQFAKAFE
jgi:hypothetical protein